MGRGGNLKVENPSRNAPITSTKTYPRSSLKNSPLESSDETSLKESGSSTKARTARKKVTLESHLEKYSDLLKVIDLEIERKQKEREKGARVLRSVRKTLKELEKEVPKLSHARRRAVSTGAKKVSGLELKYRVSDELADFMKIPRGSSVSRNDATNAVCVYVHIHSGETRPQMVKWSHLNPGGKRNLQDPENKMAILPDKALRRLLRYDEYCRHISEGKITREVTDKTSGVKEEVVVDDPTLKYCTVQKLLCPHLGEVDKTAPLVEPPAVTTPKRKSH
jgi:chromatin remodeling complex protein RSC6